MRASQTNREATETSNLVEIIEFLSGKVQKLSPLVFIRLRIGPLLDTIHYRTVKGVSDIVTHT
jgi:hypothetical protein